VRHAGLWRAFDLSAWGYFLDFALVPVAVVALFVFDPDWAMAAAGLATWTFAEYWIHRLLFHGKTPFEPMHQMHHALPKDMIGVASWGTFAGFAVVLLITGASFTAGFMAGYLAYCAIHVRMHHGERSNFDRYTAFMFAHHAGHHRGGAGNFGVSSPAWDFVFRTYNRRT
jgi:dihydroceramide fatty acyl 2-hydroxylase